MSDEQKPATGPTHPPATTGPTQFTPRVEAEEGEPTRFDYVVLVLVVAFIVVYSARNVVMDVISDPSFQVGSTLAARASDAVGTGIFLLFVGALVGAVGSAVAVRRFLDV